MTRLSFLLFISINLICKQFAVSAEDMHLSKAWGILNSANTPALIDAAREIVKHGNEEELPKLLTVFENEEFLRIFAFPEIKTDKLDAYPFSTLTHEIAATQTALAEKLLMNLLKNEKVIGRQAQDQKQVYDRYIAIVNSLGQLNPNSDAIYEFLTVQLNAGGEHTRIIRVLAKIGNQRSIKLLVEKITSRPDFFKKNATKYEINELGHGRDKLETFRLLLDLLVKSPTNEMREIVLRTLIDSKTLEFDPDSGQYELPSYKSATPAVRSQLREQYQKVDSSKFDPESLRQFEKLAELLSEPKP